MDEVVRYSVSDRRITIRVNESDGASIGAPLSVDRDTHWGTRLTTRSTAGRWSVWSMAG